jgi:hypothetical protein
VLSAPDRAAVRCLPPPPSLLFGGGGHRLTHYHYGAVWIRKTGDVIFTILPEALSCTRGSCLRNGFRPAIEEGGGGDDGERRMAARDLMAKHRGYRQCDVADKSIAGYHL